MLVSRSVLVIRDSSSICFDSDCSGLPVMSSRAFSSPTAFAAESKSVGTEETTFLNVPSRPSSSLPVAPVLTRIVS